MKTSFKCLLAICLFLPAMAGASQPSSTLFNLLERNGVLKVELELSLSTLEENTKNENYYPATFRFTDNTGAAQEWDTRVRARGRYRRRVCDFPPLKIDFGKDDLQKKGLMPFDDLKLVTHCMDGDDGDDAALREYLGYVLYQKLTGYILRAQLVEVAYKDTDGRRKITQYGILLGITANSKISDGNPNKDQARHEDDPLYRIGVDDGFKAARHRKSHCDGAHDEQRLGHAQCREGCRCQFGAGQYLGTGEPQVSNGGNDTRQQGHPRAVKIFEQLRESEQVDLFGQPVHFRDQPHGTQPGAYQPREQHP